VCLVVACPAGQRARCCQDWKLGFSLANAADFGRQFLKFFFLQLAFADWAAFVDVAAVHPSIEALTTVDVAA